MKKALIIMGIITLILLIASLIYCQGWRIRGFDGCNGFAGARIVNIDENSVRIKGGVAGSGLSLYVGYISKIEGDTLYIGVNHVFWPLPWNNGEFDITIPLEKKINKVVLKGGEREKVIYEDDKIMDK